MQNKKIIEFYGETCPHCHAIAPSVDRLEREERVAVERLEVWNNEENKARMDALARLYGKECGGNMIVPSFYDPAGDRLLCNPGSYERLREWVLER